MRISFSPQLRDDTLILEQTSTDRLKINGGLFDFATLPDGGTIPAGVVPSDWIVGPVERVDGEVRLTLRLPLGDNPSPAVAFPEPITVAGNGPIAVPHDPVVEPDEPELPSEEETANEGDADVDA